MEYPSTEGSMIQVEGLIFDYPGYRAIDNVSFTIARGSVTSIVGPNGAGKTTLLKCLAALIKPLSGSLTVNEVDIVQNPWLCRRSVGYVSDFFGLYDSLTVREYLTYFACARNITHEDTGPAVTNTALQLNLHGRIDRRIRTLSRGMRQRLAIAQAIIHNPCVLLLDEPASGLDPEARYALSMLLRQLNGRGMTILVSSHILVELEDYSTDMIILNNGRIVEHKALKERSDSVRKITFATIDRTGSNLHGLLQEMQGVDRFEIIDNRVNLFFTGDEIVQHRILKELILKEVPVYEFAAEEVSLQDEYFKHVKEGHLE